MTIDFHCKDGKWRKSTVVANSQNQIRLKYKENDEDKTYIGWEGVIQLGLCVTLYMPYDLI